MKKIITIENTKKVCGTYGSSKRIMATEYVDVYDLADDSQFSVKPADIQDLLKNMEGILKIKLPVGLVQ